MGPPFNRLDHPVLIRIFLDGVRARNGGWVVKPDLDIPRQFTTSPERRELILDASH